jgi:hypothetical protein
MGRQAKKFPIGDSLLHNRVVPHLGINNRCTWAGGTFLRCLRKVPCPFMLCMCIARIRLEKRLNNK